jgi:hypothetical protein
MRFQVLTAASMKLRGTRCLHHQGPDAARTSETSVDIQLRTRQYILEDSEVHY